MNAPAPIEMAPIDSFTGGGSTKLACPFHGWTRDLDGKLVELPCAWGVDPSLSAIFDQDTGNMGRMQEGMGAAKKKGATFTNDQESRIRHVHHTLDAYLGLKGTPLAAR